jgi:Zn-dependent protease
MIMMAMAGFIAGAAVYFWLVCRGQKAATLCFPSFSDVETLWERGSSYAWLPQTADLTVEELPDGASRIRHVYLGTETVHITKVMPVDRPHASVRWTQFENVNKGRVIWELQQADERPYGSLLTVSFYGKTSPLWLLVVLMGSLWFAMRVCWFAPRRGAEGRPAVPSNKPDVWTRRAGKPAAKARAKSFFDEHAYEIILSLLACASFALDFGFDGMLLLAPIILLHEYGHLLGYQLTGKTGNKMMLVPFFGGIAVAGSEHKSEFDNAFCSIMGPAICVPLSLALTGMTFLTADHWTWWWFAYAAMLCSSMNAFNLLPMMPLDGGHSFSCVARSIAPSQASMALLVLTVSGAILLQASNYGQLAGIVGVWGTMSIVQRWGQHAPVTPLSGKTGAMIAIFHLGTFAIHAMCALVIWHWFY